MISICILRAIFASTFIIGKNSLHLIRPIFLVGSRMAISGALLLIWYLFRHRSVRIEKKHIGIFLQIALFKVYIAYVFDTLAAQYVSSHKWALIWTMAPFITAIFSWFFLKEKFGKFKILALFFGFLGFIPIIFITNPQSSVVESSSIPYLPEFVMILTMLSYSYAWIVTKKLVYEYEGILINGVTMFLGGVAALVTSFFVEAAPLYPHCSGQQFMLWASLGVIANIAAYELYIVLLRHHSPTLLSFAALLDPIIVSFFGWLVYSRTISWYFFFSIILLSIGLYIFWWAEKNEQE